MKLRKIDRPEVSSEIMDKVFMELSKRFNACRNKKGSGAITPLETYAKGQEESYECLMDLHKKNWDGFKNELYDVAITAIWGIMSLEALSDE